MGRAGAGVGRSQSGFSLVEILVVITLIGLLVTFGFQGLQLGRDTARVAKCQDNLRQIGQALLLYKDSANKGRWPSESGIRFLLTLYRHRDISGRGCEVFLCPGTQDRNDLGASAEPGSSYEDWDSLTSDSISYAGRDAVAHPVRGANDGEQVLAADDNEFAPNHRKVINVLYGDASVQPYDMFSDGIEILEASPEFEELGIPVGPESPIEAFQVLRKD